VSVHNILARVGSAMYLCRKTEVNCGKLPLPLLSIVDDMRTKLTKHWCRHFMLHKVDSFFVLCTFLGVGRFNGNLLSLP